MTAKDRNYYTARRDDLVHFVPGDARRVLEIGCGTGLTGKAIKETRGGSVEVVGVEREPDVAGGAAANIDRVIVGDVETLTLPYENYFDCAIYGDVLEHLIDPWGVLRRHREALRQNGVAIASIPNISHYRVIKMLRNNIWSYSDSGVLDRSHLRFFTLASMREMFEKAGFVVTAVRRKMSASKAKKALNALLFGAISESLTEQYIVVARKSYSAAKKTCSDRMFRV
ncbi:MAG: class I SAM-dependent methyltransferase [Candidatus Omnitrophota bacterium]